MRTQLHSPKGWGAEPPISAYLYCGQTAVCIKMPLGMEVCLSAGDFVLDEDPAPTPKRGGAPPNFRPMSIVAKWWMDEDAAWYGSRPQPRPQCTRRGPTSQLPRKGHGSPLFSAHIYCGHDRPSQLLLSSCSIM